MTEDEVLKVMSIVSGVLALLLTISETLAWSKCKWNSITEFLVNRNVSCTRDVESQTAAAANYTLARRAMHSRAPTPIDEDFVHNYVQTYMQKKYGEK